LRINYKEYNEALIMKMICPVCGIQGIYEEREAIVKELFTTRGL